MGAPIHLSHIIELPGLATPPALSPATSCRFYFDGADLQLSENGGPWSPILSVGNVGWQDLGPTVELVTASDRVGAGASPAATEKFRINFGSDADASSVCRTTRQRLGNQLDENEYMTGFSAQVTGDPNDEESSTLYGYIAEPPLMNASLGRSAAVAVWGDVDDWDVAVLGYNNALRIETQTTELATAGYPIQIIAGQGTGGQPRGAVYIDGADLFLGDDTLGDMDLRLRGGGSFYVDGNAAGEFQIAVNQDTVIGSLGRRLGLYGGPGGDADAVTPGGNGAISSMEAGYGGTGSAAQVSGAGGWAYLRGGAAGADGGAGGNTGGDVEITAGAGSGAGSNGVIRIGTADTSKIVLGNNTDDPQAIFYGSGEFNWDGDEAAALYVRPIQRTIAGTQRQVHFGAGIGYASVGATIGGEGGGAYFAAGNGGAGQATQPSGRGGAAYLAGGAAGAANGGNGHHGGNVYIDGGDADSAGSARNGGWVLINAGVGASGGADGTFEVGGGAGFRDVIFYLSNLFQVNTYGGKAEFSLKDDEAAAFGIVEGANNYFVVTTTNGAEKVEIGNATTNPDATFLGTGDITLGAVGAKLAFFGHTAAALQNITGALSTVADAPAKAVLTSIILALDTYGLVNDTTT